MVVYGQKALSDTNESVWTFSLTVGSLQAEFAFMQKINSDLHRSDGSRNIENLTQARSNNDSDSVAKRRNANL